jgi:tripartite-type tricarboxylate transporter receptor subunit TctC
MIKRCFIAAAFALAGVATASAQTYPNRPITMIVPFAAGGPTDVLGRLIGQRMGEILRILATITATSVVGGVV